MRLYDLAKTDLRPETPPISADVRPGCFLSGTACALGGFDGIHVGHMAILRRTVGIAAENGLVPAVWTFETAPGALDSAAISTTEQRLRLFAGAGIRFAAVESFDGIRSMPAEDFVSAVLAGTMGCAVAVCGFNFTFGQGGAAHSDDLSRLMHRLGGRAETVPEVKINGETVSSTRIRALLRDGDPAGAAAMLGRPFTVEGGIIHGRRLGHSIGFPTCNQRIPDGVIVPKLGVYATEIEVGGASYPSVTNIGMRPTVADMPGGDSEPVAETHIIGENVGELYGMPAVTRLLGFIRPEKRFDYLSGLTAQMERDVETRMSGRLPSDH